MPLRLAAGLAASVSFVAFVVSAARIGAQADDPAASALPARPAAATAAPPAQAAAEEPAKKAAAAPSKRRHVPPGVLARAASKRAKEREPCAGSRAECDAQSTVESIEIDWHAQTSTP